MKQLLERYGWKDSSIAGVELWTKEASKFFVIVRGSSWEAKRRGRQASDKPVAKGQVEQLEAWLKKN